MHNETIQCKKVTSIVISIIAITIALYLFQIIQMSIQGSLLIVKIATIVLPILTILVLIKEVYRCIIAYKYSIIGDKLIINKINGRTINNEESIRIDNIVYLGEKGSMPKKFSRVKCNKYHSDIFVSNSKIYCIYSVNGKLIKFSFTPSERLVQLIHNKSNKTVKVEAI